jgi:cyanophycinase-like exopeptidase
VIADSQFAERNRMGRTLVFLARLLHDGKARPASSIAVGESNAVLLEGDGSAMPNTRRICAAWRMR